MTPHYPEPEGPMEVAAIVLAIIFFVWICGGVVLT